MHHRRTDDCRETSGASASPSPALSRLADILTVLFFAVTLSVCALLILVTPDAPFSENENRVLQQKPRLSSSDAPLLWRIADGKLFDRVADGRFADEVGRYCKDQFPLRNLCLTVHSAAEILFGKQEVNGVLVGKNDTLIVRDDYPNREALDANLAACSLFAREAEKTGIPCVAAIAARTADIYGDRAPFPYGVDVPERIWDWFSGRASAYGLDWIDLSGPLREAYAQGGEVYFRTDHHWTAFGAQVAYRTLGESLGYEPFADFSLTPVSETFFGTSWSRVLLPWIRPDILYLPEFEGDDRFVVSVTDTGAAFSGFYDRSKLKTRDQYASFLGGNFAQVGIRSADADADRQTLLVVKDSFAHSLVPFLARHYDLILIDPRYYPGNPLSLLRNGEADRVLLLFSLGSLTDPILTPLAAGIDR